MLTACGGNKEVTITIPVKAPFVAENLTAEVIAELEEYFKGYGAEDIAFNDEEFVVTMTKSHHDALMKAAGKDIEEIFFHYQASEHGHFLEMDVKDNYETTYVTTESVALEEHITWTYPITTLGLNALMYQLYSGVATDELQETVHIIDGETEETFESVEFPAFFYGEIK